MTQESIEQNTENNLESPTDLQESGISNGTSANTTSAEEIAAVTRKRPGPKVA
ncbi:hypothetical protein IQ264_17205 [Phormidium sp. LEGE 05292]|uniref:hypothetical protein n=1 Tax=[Phormidium] sp. LEGE 05292 TaxID=767427 RepID=UPI00188199D0|nr:hypothetical protein [Phormidium sp. LEGE 05292]MBE9227169.1 hypothetical protein [Phormidium sp. LEGE 05292]